MFPEGLPEPLPGNNAILDDPNLCRALSLNWSEDEAEEFRSSIPEYEFLRLSKQDFIPPKDFWAPESESAATHLETRLNGKKADKRVPAKSVRRSDKIDWRMVVGEDTSCIIVDTKSKDVVGAVIRNLVGDKAVLSWLDSVAAKQVEWGRDVRVSTR